MIGSRMAAQPRATRTALIGLTTAALGAALLAWLVARVGVGAIAAGVRQVGWGFAAILAISSVRLLARAFAWTRCLDPAYSLPLRDAFAAGLCAETIGSLT
ncbi:MAG: hypothetical protein ACRD1S_01215, partial [Vicinamibacterales bacterium]